MWLLMQNRTIYGDELIALDNKGPSTPFNRSIIAMAAGCGLELDELAKITRERVYRSDYEVYQRSWLPESITRGKK